MHHQITRCSAHHNQLRKQSHEPEQRPEQREQEVDGQPLFTLGQRDGADAYGIEHSAERRDDDGRRGGANERHEVSSVEPDRPVNQVACAERGQLQLVDSECLHEVASVARRI
jgi:hypothetical protein